MSRRIVILFAQESEARATLDALKAEPLIHHSLNIWSEGEKCSCYLFSQGRIVLTGMGTHAAQMAVATHAMHGDLFWNLGFAATLNENQPLTTLVPIQTVDKHCMLPAVGLDPLSHHCLSTTLPSFALETAAGARLISSDYPIHNATLRQQLALKWDLVDMEGYGIAFAAQALAKKCQLWKIVSDFASPGGRELIRKNKPLFSEKLANFVLEQLKLHL